MTWCLIAQTRADGPIWKSLFAPDCRNECKKRAMARKNSNMDEINQYAKYDKQQLRREIELIDPTVIVCGYTISSLQIIMERDKNYRQPNANLYYILELNGHAVIVLDYYHPSNHYPAVMNYYGLLGIYQQALIHIRRKRAAYR